MVTRWPIATFCRSCSRTAIFTRSISLDAMTAQGLEVSVNEPETTFRVEIMPEAVAVTSFVIRSSVI